MRTAQLITRVVPLCTILGCSVPPSQEPAFLESLYPLNGRFVGTIRIVENYSSDKAKVTKCEITFEFVDGNYSSLVRDLDGESLDCERTGPAPKGSGRADISHARIKA